MRRGSTSPPFQLMNTLPIPHRFTLWPTRFASRSVQAFIFDATVTFSLSVPTWRFWAVFFRGGNSRGFVLKQPPVIGVVLQQPPMQEIVFGPPIVTCTVWVRIANFQAVGPPAAPLSERTRRHELAGGIYIFSSSNASVDCILRTCHPRPPSATDSFPAIGVPCDVVAAFKIYL